MYKSDSCQKAKVAVVIPCYKVKRHILDLLSRIGPDVWRIYTVDDCCPEKTGAYITEFCTDSRVRVLYNQENTGVGGAVLNGFKKAIEDEADILVKLDGDGQMDPALLPKFIDPIAAGLVDYTKGNRFFDLTHIGRMPLPRIIGNAGLSFMTKLSSGYWNIFDPTNGYIAISAEVAKLLPMDKISKRYFFESDMLFRLNTVRAVVVDIPMSAVYNDEESNLNITRELGRFFFGNLKNTAKRVFYNYFLRDLNTGSFELVGGVLFLAFGCAYGAFHWIKGYMDHEPATSGTVMVAALPVIVGLQLLLGFINYDVANVPTYPLQSKL